MEHDEEIIRAADMLIDMGPKAGVDGGRIVFQGSIGSGNQDGTESLTLQYLSGERQRYVRQKRSWTYSITVEGAMEHNLKDIDVKFPLGVLTAVSGVSGSGKSSLVGDILYPALYRRINQTGDLPGVFRKLSGNLDRVTRVEYVDQNPIGKSSRSNAVTYLKTAALAEPYHPGLFGIRPGVRGGVLQASGGGFRCHHCGTAFTVRRG